jgi:hypothetical protein
VNATMSTKITYEAGNHQLLKDWAQYRRLLSDIIDSICNTRQTAELLRAVLHHRTEVLNFSKI